jgi:putative membrane protein
MEATSRRNRTILIWVLTLAINGLVVVSFVMPQPEFLQKMDFSMLPAVNAVLNSLTFLFLLFSLIAIKQKKIQLHRNLIFAAFSTTGIFLVTYLLYHMSTPSTPYGGEGVLKAIYLFILLTHILLAAIIVPLALFTISRGLNMDVERHRKIAKWTMPLWLYVSLTGVIVYLMISPYY